MTHWITLYDSTTGAILYSAPVEEGLESNYCLSGQDWLEGHWSADTHFVDVLLDPPEVASKGDIMGVITVATNTVSDIPAGTRITIFNGADEPADTLEEFEVEVAQTIQVTLDNPRYVRVTFDVECVP